MEMVNRCKLQRSAADRLSLPRRNYPAADSDTSPQKYRPGLPPNPLPTWVTLPMDAKLPMIPGPQQNVQLYTTNLGEKMHKSSPELDFDLTDPYSMVMSNDYKPLHDPHLKSHVDTVQMKKRLLKGNFITREGKVICTLREYNQYRQYLRKINLALDRKHESEETQLDRPIRQGKDGHSATRLRETRVRRIRERLQQQFEEDKARYQRLMAQEEERTQRFKEQELSRMSQKERLHRQEQEQKQALIEQKQEEDRRRKMMLLKTWMAEDEKRSTLAESRRKLREKERRQQLTETWNERHRLQKKKLEQEQQVRLRSEQMTKHRIKERERIVQKQRERQLAIYQRMREEQRMERAKREAECARRIAQRIEWKRTRHSALRRHKGRVSTKDKQFRSSSWCVPGTLLQEFMGTDLTPPERSFSVGPPAISDQDTDQDQRSTSDGDISKQVPDRKKTKKPQKDARGTSKSVRVSPALAGVLSGFRGVRLYDQRGKLQDYFRQKRLKLKPRLNKTKSSLGLGEFSGAKFKVRFAPEATVMHIEDNYRSELDIEDRARLLVQVNTYLASKVIYPALLTTLKERTGPHGTPHKLPLQRQRSVRFSSETDVVPVTSRSFSPPSPPHDLVDLSTDDEDDLDDAPTSLTLLSATDSLTKLRRMSNVAIPDQPVLRSLSDVLAHILEMIETGALSRDKAGRLANAARDILGDSAVVFLSPLMLSPTPSSEVSDGELSRCSSTSLVAAEVVRRTLESVQSELLNEFTDDEFANLWEVPLGRPTSSQLTGMAKFVAETALAMAAESLMGCADEVLETLPHTSPKFGRDSAASDTALLSRTSHRPLKSASQESVSCTSHFIISILEKVVSEIRAEYGVPPPGREPMSDTLIYVQDVLHQAVRGTLAVVSVERLHRRPESESSTSQFVLNTLEKVVNEMRKSRPPSATSLYIEDLVNRVAEEKMSMPNLSPDHVHRSDTSVTSTFIRDTLSRVLQQIEADLSPKPSESVASTFAKEIVNATLRKCRSAVRQDMLPSKKLTELTATIIFSQQKIKTAKAEEDTSKQNVAGEVSTENAVLDETGSSSTVTKTLCSDLRINTPTCVKSLDQMANTVNVGSTNSSLVEGLIQETVHKAQEALERGTISAEEIVKCVNKMRIRSRSSSILEDGGKTVRCDSNTAVDASTYVTDAIEDVLAEISTHTATVTVDASKTKNSSAIISPKSSDLRKISELVGSIIEKAARQLHEGLTDDVTIKLIETTIKKSLEDTPGEDESKDTDLTPYQSQEDLLEIKQCDTEPTSDVELGDLLEDSSSEEEDVKLQPVFEGKPIDIDPDVVGKALGAISVKDLDEMDEPDQILPRNSFANLTKPNITNLSGIDTSNVSAVRSDLVRASKGQLPSQSRLAITAASQTKTAMALKAKGLKTTSLKHVRRKQSPSSPYNSPEASPQSSKTRLTKGKFVAASTPVLKTVSGTTSKQTPKQQGSTPTVKTTPNQFDTKVMSSKQSASPKQSSHKSFPLPKPPTTSCDKGNVDSTSYPKITKKRSIGSVRGKDAQVVSSSKLSSMPGPATCPKETKTAVKKKDSKSQVTLPQQEAVEVEIESRNNDVDNMGDDSPAMIKSLCGSHATVVRQVSSSSSQQADTALGSPKENGSENITEEITLPCETKSQEIILATKCPSKTTSKTSSASLKNSSTSLQSIGKGSTSPLKKKTSKSSRNSHQSLDLTPRPSSVFGQSHNSIHSSNSHQKSDVERRDSREGSDLGEVTPGSQSVEEDKHSGTALGGTVDQGSAARREGEDNSELERVDASVEAVVSGT